MNIGFIGGGVNSAIGNTHFCASTMDNKFKLVAGCFSRDEKVNKETGEKYGVNPEHVYSNYEDMLDKEKDNLDAVAVLLPTSTHCEAIKACLEHNIPVISEKSLAMSSQECRDIIDAVDKSKGFCCVTFNYTGYPMMHYLKSQIQSGALGKINKIVIEMPQEGFIRLGKDKKKPHPQEWRLKDYVVPTISLDLGSHLHNMIAFLTKETPVKVLATERRDGFFDNIVDDVSALIEYTNDMSVHMWFSKVALGNRNGLNIRVYGEKGSACWNQMEPEKLIQCNEMGQVSIMDRSLVVDTYGERFKPGHPSGFIEAFANYYQEIYRLLEEYKINGAMESEFVLGLSKSEEGLRLFEAAHRSHLSKEWENV